MHTARAVPGWQYYRSGRCRSFLFLWFQSKISSPGKQADSTVCELIITGTILSPDKGPGTTCHGYP